LVGRSRPPPPTPNPQSPIPNPQLNHIFEIYKYKLI